MAFTEFDKIRRKIVFEYMDRFNDYGSLTIARKIYKEHPELFITLEHCRSYIRYYRGKSGKYNRHYMTTRKYVRE